MRQGMVGFWDGSGISWTICISMLGAYVSCCISLSYLMMDFTVSNLPTSGQHCTLAESDIHNSALLQLELHVMLGVC